MFESADGFSVSFTRQCCGIGSRSGGGGVGAPPRAPRPAAAGGGAGAGCGGGVKMPAATTSDPTTVAWSVERVVRLLHGVDALTRRTRPKASMGFVLLAFLLPDEVNQALFVLQANVIEQLRVEHDGMMQRDGPRRGVGLGIVDRDFDVEPAEVDASEALGHR